MLDYPGKLSCIFWFAGCNMRCQYCYNPEIVRGKGSISMDDALTFLDQRKGLLDAVVLSGGECTMHKRVAYLLEEIRARQFLIKIDTNGSEPRVLEQFISEGWVDYVALDFKAMKKKFYHITRSDLFYKFEKSLDMLIRVGIPFEVRTTVHSRLITKEDLVEMSKYLKEHGYRGIYYLQAFFNDCNTIENLENDTQSIADDIHEHCYVPVALRNG